MPIKILKDAILWSMKENLTIQFLYPDYILPEEYKNEIAKTFHADIVSSTCDDIDLRENADVIVFDSFAGIKSYTFNQNQAYVLRTTFSELFNNVDMLYSILPVLNRLNIVITDINSLKEDTEVEYAKLLDSLTHKVANEYKEDHGIQINILTDRILLDGMNNCNAGDETIALCPDGNFYVCPAFYSALEKSFSVGNITEGLNIKNPQLYKLSHAPICRICDAYQCRRCIWLNRNSTLEVNTPGREQCVVAHLERNASRKLLALIREIGQFLPEKEISEIDYIDPFDVITNSDK